MGSVVQAGEDDVTGDKELVKRPTLGRGEHRAEGVEVAVDVRDAKKEHDRERL